MKTNTAVLFTTHAWLPLIRLARPKQWVKNSFVFAPLLFSGHFLETQAMTQSCYIFMLFCAAATATYILNDIVDYEQDKQHPYKSLIRPLAAHTLSFKAAYTFLLSCYSILIIGFLYTPWLCAPILAYLLLNIAYTFILKHYPIIDIFTIATGFVLRVYAGAVAINVPVSHWMFITTFSLALYLATMKRHQELLCHDDTSRKVLAYYTLPLINHYATLSSLSAVLFYSMFVMSLKPTLILTIPFTLFGLFRYHYLVEKEHEGESPTDILLSDLPLGLTVILWVITSIGALWPTPFIT